MRFDPKQTNPVAIVLFIVTIGGLFAAIAAGQLVAHNDFTKLGAIAGGSVAIFVCLGMGKKIWMLIPLGVALTGKISVLPLPFSVRDLCIFAAFVIFVALAVFKRLPKIANFQLCDWFMLGNLAYLFTVYLRNPVGTRALGSDIVGGKPYLDVLTSVLAFWVLQHVTITVKESRIIPWMIAAGSTGVAALGVLTQKFPFLVPLVAPFYSDVNVGAYMAEQNATTFTANRQASLFSLIPLTGVMLSFYRPLQLFLFSRPFQSLILYGALAGVMLSGFRTAFIFAVVLIVMNSYFYAGLKDVIRVGIVVLLGAIFVVALQSSGVPVNSGIQRALSFIPAPWDEGVLSDATDSSEWRFEIWKIALESNKYIKDKILGDGFGFSAADLQLQMQAAWGGQGYIGGERAETQLIQGAYHSGPISAIRYVGVVGLLLFIFFLIACARYAWIVIRRTKGTPFFPMALFVGVPIIYKPFCYIFIFGAFENDFRIAIVDLAFLNLVARGFEAFRAESLKSSPQSSLDQPRDFVPAASLSART